MNAIHKLRILGFSLVLLAGLSVQQKVAAQPGVSISFQTFYHELSPYGRWINNPQYGTVWTPYVDNGFQPYSTNGYWEMTDYGNTWVSDYDWGWAPFHYGRWSYDDYAGWFWIPGYEWGPAWVNWRSGGGYYGWAPMGPGVNINVSINIPSFWWVFVPQRYMCTPNWHNYWVPRNRITHIYNQTTIINNYYRSNNRVYVAGPRRDEVAYVTRRDIPVRQIDNSRRGRVIVASNSRGNDNYNSRDSYNSRSNNTEYRNENRRVEAGRIPGRNENNDRGSRGGYSNDRSADPNSNRTTPSDFNDRSANRSESRGDYSTGRDNNRTSVPDNGNRSENRSSTRGGGYQPGESPAGNPSANRDYNRGQQSSPSPSYRTERSERSSGGNSDFGRGQQSSPSFRSAPAERSAPSQNQRSGGSPSENSGGSRSGGSERGGRSPRG